MTRPGHVDFYTIILFIHIVAAIAAFGISFAYPLIDKVVHRLDVKSLPAYHELQIQIARRLVTPSAILVFAAGLYLALDRWRHFSSGWYSGAIVIIIIILGIEHALLIPNARRLRDRAALDVRESSGGTATVALSTEYTNLQRQRAMWGGIIQLLVVVAVFLMVVKPGV